MRGPYWTPITPLTGSLLHADPHPPANHALDLYSHVVLYTQLVLRPLVVEDEDVDPGDRAADVPGFGVPTDPIAHFESFRYPRTPESLARPFSVGA